MAFAALHHLLPEAVKEPGTFENLLEELWLNGVEGPESLSAVQWTLAARKEQVLEGQ